MLAITHTVEDQCLLEAADLAEAAHARGMYDQRCIGQPNCGAPGCLLGNYFVAHPEFWLALRRNNSYTVGYQRQFGLSSASEVDEIFSTCGCDNAGTDGRKAAAYVRAFVEKRAKARLSA